MRRLNQGYRLLAAVAYSTAMLVAVMLFVHCATPSPPLGGLKDEIPPEVVPDKSTPNFQTNFQKQRVELTFDEWVQVQDIFNQVVVSPPLQHRFKVSLKGKTVRFDFDEREVLREDVTYTINFGEAVQDLSERNPAEGLRFVFSTGAYLDSLQVSGILVDAITADSVKGGLFMLYDNFADSVVRTQRPFYFSKTDKKGNFKIENVKAGTYKAFALEDTDFNYLFNQQAEKIGFPDGLVTISDTAALPLRLLLFQEEPSLRVFEVDTAQYGLVKVLYNRLPNDLQVSSDGLATPPRYAFDKDTLKVWYTAQAPDTLPWKLYLQQDTSYLDTLPLSHRKQAAFLRGAKLLNNSPGTVKIHPADALKLRFSHPLASFDTSLIRMVEQGDSLATPLSFGLRIDTTDDGRTLLLSHPWPEDKKYILTMLPQAIGDWYGLRNADTLSTAVQIDNRRNYGNILLTLNGLDSAQAYVLQLISPSGLVLKESRIADQRSHQERYPNLPPGGYSIQIVTDRNRNGRWDTGRYDTATQPEPRETKKLDNLRANWDLDTVVKLGQTKKE